MGKRPDIGQGANQGQGKIFLQVGEKGKGPFFVTVKEVVDQAEGKEDLTSVADHAAHEKNPVRCAEEKVEKQKGEKSSSYGNDIGEHDSPIVLHGGKIAGLQPDAAKEEKEHEVQQGDSE